MSQDNSNILNGYTLFSGGAAGADSFFGELLEKHGARCVHFYHPSDPPGSKMFPPKGNTPMPEADIPEAQQAVTRAARRMYGYDNASPIRQGLTVRDFSQAKNADAVIAVGRLASPGEKYYADRAKDERVCQIETVTGGTGYAVNIAIEMGKPVYVFNQVPSSRFPIGWYTYSAEKQTYIPCETPVLTKNVAGIGSRNLTDEGRNAIESCIRKTVELVQAQAQSHSEKEDTAAQDNKEQHKKITIEAYPAGELTRAQFNQLPGIKVYTENTNHTSGNNPIDQDSWFVKTFGDGEHVLNYPTKTLAVMRGLSDCYPITTQHWYDPANGRSGITGRWNDSDVDEFRKYIIPDFQRIKVTLVQKVIDTLYSNDEVYLWLPGAGAGLFNTKISNISKERVPVLFDILSAQVDSLRQFIDTINNDILKNENLSSEEIEANLYGFISALENTTESQKAKTMDTNRTHLFNDLNIPKGFSCSLESYNQEAFLNTNEGARQAIITGLSVDGNGDVTLECRDLFSGEQISMPASSEGVEPSDMEALTAAVSDAIAKAQASSQAQAVNGTQEAVGQAQKGVEAKEPATQAQAQAKTQAPAKPADPAKAHELAFIMPQHLAEAIVALPEAKRTPAISAFAYSNVTQKRSQGVMPSNAVHVVVEAEFKSTRENTQGVDVMANKEIWPAVNGVQMHFGNPFEGKSEDPVAAYMDWLTGARYNAVEQERRSWIVQAIFSGAIYDKDIVYMAPSEQACKDYNPKANPTHANVLRFFANKPESLATYINAVNRIRSDSATGAVSSEAAQKWFNSIPQEKAIDIFYNKGAYLNDLKQGPAIEVTRQIIDDAMEQLNEIRPEGEKLTQFYRDLFAALPSGIQSEIFQQEISINVFAEQSHFWTAYNWIKNLSPAERMAAIYTFRTDKKKAQNDRMLFRSPADQKIADEAAGQLQSLLGVKTPNELIALGYKTFDDIQLLQKYSSAASMIDKTIDSLSEGGLSKLFAALRGTFTASTVEKKQPQPKVEEAKPEVKPTPASEMKPEPAPEVKPTPAPEAKVEAKQEPPSATQTQMGKVFVSYYASKNIPDDAFRVQISNGTPKDVHVDADIKSLHPDWDTILTPHKEGKINDEEYTKRYNSAIKAKEGVVLAELNSVRQEAQGRDVYLLCYERPGAFCHRYLVKDFLNEHGIECQEAPGDRLQYEAAVEAKKEPGHREVMNIWASTKENPDLSNAARYRVTLWGIDFESAEQAYQYSKTFFSHTGEDQLERVRKEILETTSIKDLRRIGFSIPDLDVESWNANSRQMMREILTESYNPETNPRHAAILLETDDAILTHDQANDEWRYDLPNILMEIRDNLRAKSADKPLGPVAVVLTKANYPDEELRRQRLEREKDNYATTEEPEKKEVEKEAVRTRGDDSAPEIFNDASAESSAETKKNEQKADTLTRAEAYDILVNNWYGTLSFDEKVSILSSTKWENQAYLKDARAILPAVQAAPAEQREAVLDNAFMSLKPTAKAYIFENAKNNSYRETATALKESMTRIFENIGSPSGNTPIHEVPLSSLVIEMRENGAILASHTPSPFAPIFIQGATDEERSTNYRNWLLRSTDVTATRLRESLLEGKYIDAPIVTAGEPSSDCPEQVLKHYAEHPDALAEAINADPELWLSHSTVSSISSALSRRLEELYDHPDSPERVAINIALARSKKDVIVAISDSATPVIWLKNQPTLASILVESSKDDALLAVDRTLLAEAAASEDFDDKKAAELFIKLSDQSQRHIIATHPVSNAARTALFAQNAGLWSSLRTNILGDISSCQQEHFSEEDKKVVAEFMQTQPVKDLTAPGNETLDAEKRSSLLTAVHSLAQDVFGKLSTAAKIDIITSATLDKNLPIRTYKALESDSREKIRLENPIYDTEEIKATISMHTAARRFPRVMKATDDLMYAGAIHFGDYAPALENPFLSETQNGWTIEDVIEATRKWLTMEDHKSVMPELRTKWLKTLFAGDCLGRPIATTPRTREYAEWLQSIICDPRPIAEQMSVNILSLIPAKALEKDKTKSESIENAMRAVIPTSPDGKVKSIVSTDLSAANEWFNSLSAAQKVSALKDFRFPREEDSSVEQSADYDMIAQVLSAWTDLPAFVKVSQFRIYINDEKSKYLRTEFDKFIDSLSEEDRQHLSGRKAVTRDGNTEFQYTPLSVNDKETIIKMLPFESEDVLHAKDLPDSLKEIIERDPRSADLLMQLSRSVSSMILRRYEPLSSLSDKSMEQLLAGAPYSDSEAIPGTMLGKTKLTAPMKDIIMDFMSTKDANANNFKYYLTGDPKDPQKIGLHNTYLIEEFKKQLKSLKPKERQAMEIQSPFFEGEKISVATLSDDEIERIIKNMPYDSERSLRTLKDSVAEAIASVPGAGDMDTNIAFKNLRALLNGSKEFESLLVRFTKNTNAIVTRRFEPLENLTPDGVRSLIAGGPYSSKLSIPDEVDGYIRLTEPMRDAVMDFCAPLQKNWKTLSGKQRLDALRSIKDKQLTIPQIQALTGVKMHFLSAGFIPNEIQAELDAVDSSFKEKEATTENLLAAESAKADLFEAWLRGERTGVADNALRSLHQSIITGTVYDDISTSISGLPEGVVAERSVATVLKDYLANPEKLASCINTNPVLWVSYKKDFADILSSDTCLNRLTDEKAAKLREKAMLGSLTQDDFLSLPKDVQSAVMSSFPIIDKNWLASHPVASKLDTNLLLSTLFSSLAPETAVEIHKTMAHQLKMDARKSSIVNLISKSSVTTKNEILGAVGELIGFTRSVNTGFITGDVSRFVIDTVGEAPKFSDPALQDAVFKDYIEQRTAELTAASQDALEELAQRGVYDTTTGKYYGTVSELVAALNAAGKSIRRKENSEIYGVTYTSTNEDGSIGRDDDDSAALEAEVDDDAIERADSESEEQENEDITVEAAPQLSERTRKLSEQAAKNFAAQKTEYDKRLHTVLSNLLSYFGLPVLEEAYTIARGTVSAWEKKPISDQVRLLSAFANDPSVNKADQFTMNDAALVKTKLESASFSKLTDDAKARSLNALFESLCPQSKEIIMESKDKIQSLTDDFSKLNATAMHETLRASTTGSKGKLSKDDIAIVASFTAPGWDLNKTEEQAKAHLLMIYSKLSLAGKKKVNGHMNSISTKRANLANMPQRVTAVSTGYSASKSSYDIYTSMPPTRTSSSGRKVPSLVIDLRNDFWSKKSSVPSEDMLKHCDREGMKYINMGSTLDKYLKYNDPKDRDAIVQTIREQYNHEGNVIILTGSDIPEVNDTTYSVLQAVERAGMDVAHICMDSHKRVQVLTHEEVIARALKNRMGTSMRIASGDYRDLVFSRQFVEGRNGKKHPVWTYAAPESVKLVKNTPMGESLRLVDPNYGIEPTFRQHNNIKHANLLETSLRSIAEAGGGPVFAFINERFTKNSLDSVIKKINEDYGDSRLTLFPINIPNEKAVLDSMKDAETEDEKKDIEENAAIIAKNKLNDPVYAEIIARNITQSDSFLRIVNNHLFSENPHKLQAMFLGPNVHEMSFTYAQAKVSPKELSGSISMDEAMGGHHAVDKERSVLQEDYEAFIQNITYNIVKQTVTDEANARDEELLRKEWQDSVSRGSNTVPMTFNTLGDAPDGACAIIGDTLQRAASVLGDTSIAPVVHTNDKGEVIIIDPRTNGPKCVKMGINAISNLFYLGKRAPQSEKERVQTLMTREIDIHHQSILRGSNAHTAAKVKMQDLLWTLGFSQKDAYALADNLDSSCTEITADTCLKLIQEVQRSGKMKVTMPAKWDAGALGARYDLVRLSDKDIREESATLLKDGGLDKDEIKTLMSTILANNLIPARDADDASAIERKDNLLRELLAYESTDIENFIPSIAPEIEPKEILDTIQDTNACLVTVMGLYRGLTGERFKALNNALSEYVSIAGNGMKTADDAHKFLKWASGRNPYRFPEDLSRDNITAAIERVESYEMNQHTLADSMPSPEVTLFLLNSYGNTTTHALLSLIPAYQSAAASQEGSDALKELLADNEGKEHPGATVFVNDADSLYDFLSSEVVAQSGLINFEAEGTTKENLRHELQKIGRGMMDDIESRQIGVITRGDDRYPDSLLNAKGYDIATESPAKRPPKVVDLDSNYGRKVVTDSEDDERFIGLTRFSDTEKKYPEIAKKIREQGGVVFNTSERQDVQTKQVWSKEKLVDLFKKEGAESVLPKLDEYTSIPGRKVTNPSSLVEFLTSSREKLLPEEADAILRIVEQGSSTMSKSYSPYRIGIQPLVSLPGAPSPDITSVLVNIFKQDGAKDLISKISEYTTRTGKEISDASSLVEFLIDPETKLSREQSNSFVNFVSFDPFRSRELLRGREDVLSSAVVSLFDVHFGEDLESRLNEIVSYARKNGTKVTSARSLMKYLNEAADNTVYELIVGHPRKGSESIENEASTTTDTQKKAKPTLDTYLRIKEAYDSFDAVKLIDNAITVEREHLVRYNNDLKLAHELLTESQNPADAESSRQEAPSAISYMGDSNLLKTTDNMGIVAIHGELRTSLSEENNPIAISAAKNIVSSLKTLDRVSIAASLNCACGRAAIEEAITRGIRVIAVTTNRLESPRDHELVNRIVRNGGLVLSEANCQNGIDKDVLLSRSAHFLAGIASTNIVLESLDKNSKRLSASPRAYLDPIDIVSRYDGRICALTYGDHIATEICRSFLNVQDGGVVDYSLLKLALKENKVWTNTMQEAENNGTLRHLVKEMVDATAGKGNEFSPEVLLKDKSTLAVTSSGQGAENVLSDLRQRAPEEYVGMQNAKADKFIGTANHLTSTYFFKVFRKNDLQAFVVPESLAKVRDCVRMNYGEDAVFFEDESEARKWFDSMSTVGWKTNADGASLKPVAPDVTELVYSSIGSQNGHIYAFENAPLSINGKRNEKNMARWKEDVAAFNQLGQSVRSYLNTLYALAGYNGNMEIDVKECNSASLSNAKYVFKQYGKPVSVITLTKDGLKAQNVNHVIYGSNNYYSETAPLLIIPKKGEAFDVEANCERIRKFLLSTKSVDESEGQDEGRKAKIPGIGNLYRIPNSVKETEKYVIATREEQERLDKEEEDGQGIVYEANVERFIDEVQIGIKNGNIPSVKDKEDYDRVAAFASFSLQQKENKSRIEKITEARNAIAADVDTLSDQLNAYKATEAESLDYDSAVEDELANKIESGKASVSKYDAELARLSSEQNSIKAAMRNIVTSKKVLFIGQEYKNSAETSFASQISSAQNDVESRIKELSGSIKENISDIEAYIKAVDSDLTQSVINEGFNRTRKEGEKPAYVLSESEFAELELRQNVLFAVATMLGEAAEKVEAFGLDFHGAFVYSSKDKAKISALRERISEARTYFNKSEGLTVGITADNYKNVIDSCKALREISNELKEDKASFNMFNGILAHLEDKRKECEKNEESPSAELIAKIAENQQLADSIKESIDTKTAKRDSLTAELMTTMITGVEDATVLDICSSADALIKLAAEDSRAIEQRFSTVLSSIQRRVRHLDDSAQKNMDILAPKTEDQPRCDVILANEQKILVPKKELTKEMLSTANEQMEKMRSEISQKEASIEESKKKVETLYVPSSAGETKESNGYTILMDTVSSDNIYVAMDPNGRYTYWKGDPETGKPLCVKENGEVLTFSAAHKFKLLGGRVLDDNGKQNFINSDGLVVLPSYVDYIATTKDESFCINEGRPFLVVKNEGMYNLVDYNKREFVNKEWSIKPDSVVYDKQKDAFKVMDGMNEGKVLKEITTKTVSQHI